MNCTVHPENAATAFCRTCGKAMCDACKRTVRGVIYCEDCIANRLNDTVPPGVVAAPAGVVVPPPPGAPSPGLAALLGFIPGVGAMYNGQFIKGVIHALIFVCLIYLASNVEGLFGILIGFWVMYMVFDAYKTAKARLYGLPLPDPFGIERAFGGHPHENRPTTPPSASGATPSSAGPAVAPGFVPPSPSEPSSYVPPPVYAPPPPRQPSPVGAVVLIGLGVLFLLNTMGLWSWQIRRFWPLILIVVGLWLFYRRFADHAGEAGQ